MGKVHKKSIFKYLLILCLSVTLLLSQAEGVHMHLEHSMSSGAVLNVHVVGVHPKLTVHDFDLTNHHGKHQDNHSAVAIDVGTDKLVNKTNLLDPLAIVLLFIILFLATPRPRRVTRQKLCRISVTSCYYLH